MAYNPNHGVKIKANDLSDSSTQMRDQCWPSEIAAQRPMCAPRIHCPASDNEEVSSIRGSLADDRVARFNEQLRSGIGTGRPNDIDE